MSTTVHGYTLQLSHHEVARYRGMAARAREYEEAAWALAGIVPGAHVADVGCGPGFVLAELARAVAPDGTVTGVDQAAEARAAAESLVAGEGLTNATVLAGAADATGLEPGSLDVVMQRHVLIHNGGSEDAIVSHLGSLLRPGGAVYLVETDLDAVRVRNQDSDLADLWERWRALGRLLGNDERVGARLVDLAQIADLEVVDVDARYDIVEPIGDMRPPSWAARQAIVDAGLASTDDLVRWEAAFQRVAASPERGLFFVPVFRVVARRPL